MISPHEANASLSDASSICQLRFPTNTVVHPSGFSLASLGELIGFGVEYLMLNQRPLKSSPLSFMQASQASLLEYSIMAVPELRPSFIRGNSREVISPQDWKYSLTSYSVAFHGSPRTNIFKFSPSSTAAF